MPVRKRPPASLQEGGHRLGHVPLAPVRGKQGIAEGGRGPCPASPDDAPFARDHRGEAAGGGLGGWWIARQLDGEGETARRGDALAHSIQRLRYVGHRLAVIAPVSQGREDESGEMGSWELAEGWGRYGEAAGDEQHRYFVTVGSLGMRWVARTLAAVGQRRFRREVLMVTE